MNRRSFFRTIVGTAGGLVLPYEPKRVYSFARELRVPGVEDWYGLDRATMPQRLSGWRGGDFRVGDVVASGGAVAVLTSVNKADGVLTYEMVAPFGDWLKQGRS